MKNKFRPIVIFHLLQRGQALRAKTLADKLCITERTLYRDIAEINETFVDHFQIVRTEEGYTMDQKVKFPEASISMSEIQALESAVHALPEGSPSLSTAKQAITRLRHQTRLESGTPAQQYISRSFPRDNTNIQTLSRLEEAIESGQILDLFYFSHNSKQHQRFLFHPYALIFRKHAWYLIGHHVKKQKTILLRVFRIQKWNRQADTFILPKSFSVDQYFEKHWEVFGGQPEPVSLQFFNTAALLIPEMTWHESQVIEDCEEGVILRLNVAIQPELIQWILGWGKDCQVLSPQGLMSQIKEKAILFS